MILTFTGKNYTLLQVTNATPEEMNAIKTAVTERVNRFQSRGHDKWNGDVSMCWYIDGFYYVPAGCWQRLWNLREPDPQTYRPAYNVEFRNQDLFFNKTVTRDDIADFVQTLNPKFADIEDQITVLHCIIRHRLSSHNIATGFGKTYLSYILSQYANKVYGGKTLMIVPRIQLVTQGIDDFNDYMQTIDADERLKCYGVCGGFANYCSFDDADVYIGTYQSISNMPADMFNGVKAVICDEGHTAKALSVAECIKKCQYAEIVTAISGTLQYSSPVDKLTIEQFCGPLISNYTVHQQIEKGRLPKIAIQPICIQHTDTGPLYDMMLEQQRLPKVHGKQYPAELASTYRSIEMNCLWTNRHLMNYLLALCKSITDMNKNVLVIFKNRQPAVNLFELANANGQKAHLIFGDTPRDVRSGIKQQIENETGWILSATDGVMSMGVSINNLHGLITCMIGHSPHVVLQSVGRMLRNHKDKFDITVCYDVYNDFSQIGTCFDKSNFEARMRYYQSESHPIYDIQQRVDVNY